MTRDDFAGLGLLLLGELRASEALGPLPPFALDQLAPVIRQIPPQFYRLGDDQPLGDWINASAAIEAQGLHHIAFDLLEEIRRLYVRNGERVAQQATDAFLWLRQARIARTSGRLDDADACYEEALQRVPRPFATAGDLWWTDVLPHAWLGMGILAVGRGNYHVAERETSRVLDSRVPSIWRTAAHLQMSIVLRKRGRAVEALEHIWAAFDLMSEDDTRRAEALVFLGEVLMGLGELTHSMQAHLAALAMGPVLRVQAAALAGIQTLLASPPLKRSAQAEAFLVQSAWGRRQLLGRPESGVVAQLIGYVTALLREVPASLSTTAANSIGVVNGYTRHDQSILARSLAELLESRGQRVDALAWLEIVERIAEKHDFHERKFEVDRLRAEWQQRRVDDTEMTLRITLPARSRRTKVWARMADLEALAALEGAEGR